MKKIIAMCLTIIVLMGCLAACNNGEKGDNKISMSTFETEMKTAHEEFKFNVSESSSGYSFEYSTLDTTYSGTADKKQNIKNVTITYNYIKNEIITDKSKMRDIISRTSKPLSLKVAELKALGFYLDVTIIVSNILGAKEMDVDSLIDVICNNESIKINGWSVSVKSRGSSATITME